MHPPAPDPRPCRFLWQVALSLWVIAIAVILIHIWYRPNSNTLYKVFRAGGARWLASENLYPGVDEYIYSPFAAACFAPLATLPDRVSGILWRLISLAAYAGAFSSWLKKAPRALENSPALAWIVLLPLSVGDFYNGQANPLVIGLLMLAILACREERWMLAAFCVAIAAYFKIYPLALGLLLAVIHPKHFPGRLLIALLTLFLVSLFLQRPGYVLHQYGNWIHSLRLDPRRTLNYFGTYRDFWLLLRLLRVPISVQGWAVLQSVAGGILAVYLFLLRRRGAPASLIEFLLLVLGVSWMLLFGPATESSTYILLAPPLVLAWLRWRFEPGAMGCATAAATSYLFLLASQMLTSWGHQYQNAWTHLIQPIAAMILASATLFYGSKFHLQPAPVS